MFVKNVHLQTHQVLSKISNKMHSVNFQFATEIYIFLYYKIINVHCGSDLYCLFIQMNSSMKLKLFLGKFKDFHVDVRRSSMEMILYSQKKRRGKIEEK